MPANVTNSAVVDGKDKEDTPDTKVKTEDAVVAKAPDGKEVDFKKLTVQEALDTLKVLFTGTHPTNVAATNNDLITEHRHFGTHI